MTGNINYIPFNFSKKRVELDMRDDYTCSFTEFFPFCIKLYYFSNFKDFNTLPQALYLQVLGCFPPIPSAGE